MVMVLLCRYAMYAVTITKLELLRTNVFIEVFKLRKMVHLSRYYDVVVKYLLKAMCFM